MSLPTNSSIASSRLSEHTVTNLYFLVSLVLFLPAGIIWIFQYPDPFTANLIMSLAAMTAALPTEYRLHRLDRRYGDDEHWRPLMAWSLLTLMCLIGGLCGLALTLSPPPAA